jgi:uncharacterized protein (TIGR00369 family)
MARRDSGRPFAGNTMTPTPRDPNFEQRIRASFAKQRFMDTLGARLVHIAPGEVHIALNHRDDLTQQHGFLHAGAVATVMDSACGYAALSLMEPGAAVLAVEFKVNLMAPAAGTEFIAVGRVERSGKTLTVCRAELRSGEKVVAMMQGTMMAVRTEGMSD